MKNIYLKNIFGSCILISAITPTLPLSSCSSTKLDQSISFDDYWTLDYVYKVNSSSRLNATYQMNLQNFIGGETVELKIESAHNLEGESIDFLKINTQTFTIEKDQSYIPFEISFTNEEKYLVENADEYTFKLLVTIKTGELEKTITTNDLWIEVAKPTLESDFVIEDGVCKGFAGKNYKDCTLFLLPKNVTSIQDKAFGSVIDNRTKIPKSMKYLVLDYTVGRDPKLEYIGRENFEESSFIGECYIPRSVKEIGPFCFYKTNFTSLTFENNTDEGSSLILGAQAFAACDKISSDIRIPDHCISIGASAFRYCENAQNLYISKSVTEIKNRAFLNYHTNLSKPASVIFPKNSNLKVIEYSAFSAEERPTCGLSGELYIPNGCSNINKWAFLNCKLIDSLSLPPSMQIFDEQTFANMEKVSTLDLSRITDINDKFFLNKNPTFFENLGKLSDQITVILSPTIYPYKDTRIKPVLINYGLDKNKIQFKHT